MRYTHLTDRQQDIVDCLPATYAEIAAELDLAASGIRAHVAEIVERGYEIRKERDGREVVLHDENEHYHRPGPRTSKAAASREYNETLLELKRWLADDLNDDPLPPPREVEVDSSNEDVVVHRSDSHIGAKYVDEHGALTYSTAIAERRERAVTDRVMKLCARQEAAGVVFDTAYLLLGGDLIHGEGIYEDQPWETEITLLDQVRTASDLYMEQIHELAGRFPNVVVVCQNGNHGELRGDGMSPGANADDIVYMTLTARVRDREYGNVEVRHSPAASYYTNFTMRGGRWNAHLRHGQKSLFHIGTSSGKKRWYEWLRRHAFDIAYRGHYHELRLEHIASTPVLMSGAICPPDDFEEGLGEWSEPAATVHGVSDERVMTWFYPVSFTDE